MRITKVNHNPTSGLTVIDYEHRENEGKDKVTSRLKSKELPHPAFLESLEHLIPRVEEVCEVEEFLESVRGVTLHREDDDEDEWTCTFTATRKISASNSPLVINTPAVVPDTDTRAGVLEVLGHAKDFIGGTRAQQELPVGEKRDSPAPTLLDNGGEAPPEEPEPDTEPVEDVAGRIYPAEEPGQIYQGKSAQGNTCTVKNTAGKPTWVGRVSGKPVAIDRPTAAEAMQMVEDHVKGEIDWQPTLELASSGDDGAPAVDL